MSRHAPLYFSCRGSGRNSKRLIVVGVIGEEACACGEETCSERSREGYERGNSRIARDEKRRHAAACRMNLGRPPVM
jgi:hypothetical protein